MIITKISETKRGRFALFSQQGFLFSVDAETLSKYELMEGSSMDEEELSSLKAASDTRRTKDAALRYLSLRAYGEAELYEKLCRRFDEHSAAATVADMRELGLLDDETFALTKAKGLLARRKSRLEIRRQLLQLGLDKQLVEQVMEEIGQNDASVAAEIVRRGYLEKMRRGEREKVIAALARRGFSYKDSKEAIETVERELEEEV